MRANGTAPSLRSIRGTREGQLKDLVDGGGRAPYSRRLGAQSAGETRAGQPGEDGGAFHELGRSSDALSHLARLAASS